LNLIKLHITLFFTALTTFACAQIVVERSVIGSSGGSYAVGGNLILDQTLGEAATATIGSDDLTLTQGFQQPEDENILLLVEVATIAASCPTSSDGVARIRSITGCTPPYEIIWSNGVSAVDSLDRLLPGFYSVTVTSAFCQETVEFEISSGPESNCAIRIFNAFTPDGDGRSDTWTIENIDRPEFRKNTVEIFNRWGAKVFSARNYDNVNAVWNGDSEAGNPLQSGTYFYTIEAGGLSFKGYVELIR
jgi:gliding motility-associated-like protein